MEFQPELSPYPFHTDPIGSTQNLLPFSEQVAPTLGVPCPWGCPECDWRLHAGPFVDSDGGLPISQPIAELPLFPQVPYVPNPPVPAQPMWLPQSQQIGGPAFSDMFNVGVGADPNVTAIDQAPAEVYDSARKRSKAPAKRRRLTKEKAIILEELRGVMEARSNTPHLQVLNAAIERLGGVVPQGYPGGRTEGKKLAYDELYKLAGCEGRLKHVSCLERVIKKLKPEEEEIAHSHPQYFPGGPPELGD